MTSGIFTIHDVIISGCSIQWPWNWYLLGSRIWLHQYNVHPGCRWQHLWKTAPSVICILHYKHMIIIVRWKIWFANKRLRICCSFIELIRCRCEYKKCTKNMRCKCLGSLSVPHQSHYSCHASIFYLLFMNYSKSLLHALVTLSKWMITFIKVSVKVDILLCFPKPPHFIVNYCQQFFPCSTYFLWSITDTEIQ